jgi:hypothetical protein
MAELEYHKGSFCYLMSAYCREGYRVDCKTCLRSQILSGKELLKCWTGEARKSQEVVGAGMPS